MKVKRSIDRLHKTVLESNDAKSFLSKNDEESLLWHSRFGHVNLRAIEQMSTLEMVHGLPKIDEPKGICTGYLVSKQKRKLFSLNKNFMLRWSYFPKYTRWE